MAYGNFSEPARALILLCGLPGAGKTTLAQRLAEHLDFAHIESDAVRRRLTANPTYSHSESGAVFAIVDAEARKCLKSGRHAAVDATNLTVKDRRRFLDIGREPGVLLIPVRVVAPEDVIRERLSRPREGHSQAGIEVYEKVRHRPEQIGLPAIVVDTRFDLTPAIRLICALVADGDR
jgi:predicted kinase